MSCFYSQNLKRLQQYHRPDRVNPRGDRIEIIFNKNGIEHLPFWSLCNKGNSDNADRSFFRKSASLPHHSDLATLTLDQGNQSGTARKKPELPD